MKQALLVAVALILGAASPAQDAPILVSPDDVKWGDAPPSLPPGAKMFVVQGDPKGDGPFVLRAKVSAGFKIPPHSTRPRNR